MKEYNWDSIYRLMTIYKNKGLTISEICSKFRDLKNHTQFRLFTKTQLSYATFIKERKSVNEWAIK